MIEIRHSISDCNPDTRKAYEYCLTRIKSYDLDYCRFCIEADDGEESGVAYPEWIDWELIKRDLEGGKQNV